MLTSEKLMDMLRGLLIKNGMDPGLLDKIGLDAALLEEARTEIRPAAQEGLMEITLRLPTPVALQLCHLLETGVVYGSLVTNAGDVKRDPTNKNDDPGPDNAA